MTTNKYTKIFTYPLFYIIFCLLVLTMLAYYKIINPDYNKTPSHEIHDHCCNDDDGMSFYESLCSLNIKDECT
jgi:hypothetical protein